MKTPFCQSRADHLISEYLRRDLCYEYDRLDAILGVLRTLGHHIWGNLISKNDVLMKPPDTRSDVEASRRNSLSNAIGQALLWRSGSDRDGSKTTRRPGSPSWSWTGWKGFLFFSGSRLPAIDVYDFDMEVNIMDDSQKFLDVHQYVQKIGQGFDIDRFEPCLYITGWFVIVRFLPTLDDISLTQTNSLVS